MQQRDQEPPIDFIEARFDALFGVARQQFPRIVLGTGAQDEWFVAGPARSYDSVPGGPSSATTPASGL